MNAYASLATGVFWQFFLSLELILFNFRCLQNQIAATLGSPLKYLVPNKNFPSASWLPVCWVWRGCFPWCSEWWEVIHLYVFVAKVYNIVLVLLDISLCLRKFWVRPHIFSSCIPNMFKWNKLSVKKFQIPSYSRATAWNHQNMYTYISILGTRIHLSSFYSGELFFHTALLRGEKDSEGRYTFQH